MVTLRCLIFVLGDHIGFYFTFFSLFWFSKFNLLSFEFSNILLSSIIVETFIVELRIWYRHIGTVNFSNYISSFWHMCHQNLVQANLYIILIYHNIKSNDALLCICNITLVCLLKQMFSSMKYLQSFELVTFK